MKINPPTEIKAVQFLGSPFRGKKAEELKEKAQEKPTRREALIKALRFIIRIWLYFVLMLIVVGSLGILFTEGIWRFWEVMSPFNFSNYFVLMVLLIPAFVLNMIANKIELTLK